MTTNWATERKATGAYRPARRRLRDGGWMGEGRPMGGHALAIIPNATHCNVFASPVLAAAALAFLDA